MTESYKLSTSTIMEIVYLIITTLFTQGNWFQVSIFALGMKFDSEGDDTTPHIDLTCNGSSISIWVKYNEEPSDYLEYFGDILSVTAENDFALEILLNDKHITQFLKNHNLYFDMGNCWNVSLYEID